MLAAFCVATSALQLSAHCAAQPAAVRATLPRLCAAADDEASRGARLGALGDVPILTLQERGDGWDDVRESIKTAGKERQKPLEELKSKYLQPLQEAQIRAQATLEVLVEELPGSVSTPKVSMPTLSMPEVSVPEVNLPTDKRGIVRAGLFGLTGIVKRLPRKGE